jgi:hypothetical protein
MTTPYSHAFNITRPFFLTSVFLNLLISASLVGRLLWYQRILSKALGSQRVDSVQYTQLASMFVEAGILYMLFSFGCLIFFNLQIPVSQSFEMPFSLVQVGESFSSGLGATNRACILNRSF